MLSVSWDTIRLFLHVLAATIWVGGQLVLGALVPVLRRFGSEAVTAVARQFNWVAWAAFAVVSGITAFVHTRVKTARARAIWGALTGLSALATLFLGVLLAG